MSVIFNESLSEYSSGVTRFGAMVRRSILACGLGSWLRIPAAAKTIIKNKQDTLLSNNLFLPFDASVSADFTIYSSAQNGGEPEFDGARIS